MMSTMMTMAAYLMKVAATIQPPPDLPGGGSLVSSSNSSKSLLLRPMLPLNPLAESPCPIINQQTPQFHHRLYGSTLHLNRQAVATSKSSSTLRGKVHKRVRGLQPEH